MTERWILAGVWLAAGLLAGALIGFFVRRRLMRARGGEATSSIAGVAGLFVFWVLTLAGALAAVAMARPATLDDLPRQVLDYTPRLLVAGLIVLAGYSISVGAARLVGYGFERASGRTVARTAALVRWSIFAAAVILALAQLGVDTTILVLLVGLIGFGVALSTSLLIGFGGRQVASEVAAGRYLARFLRVGAIVDTGAFSGAIVALHPATLEIEAGSGATRHVPYTKLMESGLTLRGGPQPPPED